MTIEINCKIYTATLNADWFYSILQVAEINVIICTITVNIYFYLASKCRQLLGINTMIYAGYFVHTHTLYEMNLSCVDAGGPEPPKLQLPTTDYLYNMTGRNISRWLVKTTMDYLKKRFAGIFLSLCSVHMVIMYEKWFN